MIRRKSKRKRRQRIFIATGIIIVVIIIAFVVSSIHSNYLTIPANTPASLPDVPQIGGNTQLAYHWHMHIDIFINGTPVLIPDDLGHVSDNTVFYAIHRHTDLAGLIHIESPLGSAQVYTLAQLFEVWGYPSFSTNQIFTYAGQSNSIYVNGTMIQFNANYPLTCHNEIAIIYGIAPSTIPTSFNFGGIGCFG